MGAKKFVGKGAGAGAGLIFGFGIGAGFGPKGFPIGVGAGGGIGIGVGWGYMAGFGAEYINGAPDFAEAKSHHQNPIQAVQGQLRKVFKRPVPHSSHPVTPSE